MERTGRVWVLPVLFSLVVLSLPAQMLFAERYSEPYPGLFQPFFYGAGPAEGQPMQLVVAEVRVDGRRIEPSDLFPGDGSARIVLGSMFPRNAPHRVGPRELTYLSETLADRVGGRPRVLTVAWQRRVYDPVSDSVTAGDVLMRHRIDLTEVSR